MKKDILYIIGLNPDTKKHYVILKNDNNIKDYYEQLKDIRMNNSNFISILHSNFIRPDQTIQDKLTILDNNLLVNQNYVNCKNNLHKNINKITPLLIEYFKTNDNIKFKTTENSLYQKNVDEIRKIIDDNKTVNKNDNFNQLYIYIDVSQYSIYVKYRDCYKSKDNGSSYLESFNYICDPRDLKKYDNNFKPYKLITLKQYEKGKIDLKKSEDQLSDLKSKISRLKHTFDL